MSFVSQVRVRGLLRSDTVAVQDRLLPGATYVQWRGGFASQTPSLKEDSQHKARFEALWNDFGPKVRARLRAQRSLDQSVDADDLEQEVYLRLWQSLSDDRNIDKPASYIFRIVNTAVIDAARRAQARESSRRSAFDLDHVEARATNNPEPAAERGEISDSVEAQFANMREDRVIAVKLHLQGFTTTEIGRMRGWTEARARNLVYRGLGQVRKKLGKLTVVTGDEQ